MIAPLCDRPLLAFDKLNLAVCAKRRAEQYSLIADRFHGEYDSCMLWMRHHQKNETGGRLNYIVA
jgi:hypothetical protein